MNVSSRAGETVEALRDGPFRIRFETRFDVTWPKGLRGDSHVDTNGVIDFTPILSTPLDF